MLEQGHIMDCKIKNVTDSDFQAKDLLYIHPRIFEMAIKAGVNALNRNTFYHPITSSGTMIWGKLLASFVAQLCKPILIGKVNLEMVCLC